MFESENAKHIIADICRGATRLFRNNVGMAWQSNRTQKFRDGSMLLVMPRLVRFGLFKGSGDYIGWTSVQITQEMVGTRVAIFTSIETKRAKKSAKSDEQKRWIKVVNLAGGRAGFAETVEQARAITTGDLCNE